MTKDNFYRTVFALVLPMAVQNLINVGVSAADVVMLGRVGETALSASSLAGQIYFIMTLIFFGLTSGAAVLTAQYWGKRDIVTIEKVLGVSISFALVVSVIFTLAAQLFPSQLMMLFSKEPEVISEGAKYLRIVSVSYILSALTMVYLNIIRSVEKVVISMVVYSISLFVNIALNAVFIFGLFGMPAMGTAGAAIGTACARLTEFIIVVFYAVKINKTVRFRFKRMICRDRLLMKDFMVYAVPVTLNELLWGSGVAVINAIVGHLGSSAAAANSVVQVVRQLAMVIIMGVANAAAIIIGKAIGSGRTDQAEEYGRRFVRMTIVLGIASGCMMFALTPVVLRCMKLGAESMTYLKYMMYLMSAFIFFHSLNSVLIVGLFRAGGDTRFGLYIDAGALWCVAIVLGLLAAFVWRLPVIAVYVFLISDEFVKTPFSLWRYFSRRWLNDVTR